MKGSIRGLFESHLTVRDLDRSRRFFEDVLGLELAAEFPKRKAAFYWIGGRGESMLGLWEVGEMPQRMNLHVAFRIELSELLAAPQSLLLANVTPRDFEGNATDEPMVLAWMPAASLYFHDPDGNLLEFLSMLPDAPEPDLGVIGWSSWKNRRDVS